MLESMRILLANQYAETRLALTLLLGREPGATIVGSVDTGAGLLALAQTVRPDMVILDHNLPGEAVKTTVHRLRETNPGLKIMLINISFNPIPLSQLIHVDAVIDHSESPDALLTAFRTLRKGLITRQDMRGQR